MRHQVFKQPLPLITEANHTRRQRCSLHCSSAQPSQAAPDPELGQAVQQHSLSPKGPKSSVPATLDAKPTQKQTLYIYKSPQCLKLGCNRALYPQACSLSTLPFKFPSPPVREHFPFPSLTPKKHTAPRKWP